MTAVLPSFHFADRPDGRQPAGSGITTTPEATAEAPKEQEQEELSTLLPVQAAGGVESGAAGEGGGGDRRRHHHPRGPDLTSPSRRAPSWQVRD